MPTEALVSAWVAWTSSFNPRVFSTINTADPLTYVQHMRAHQRVADFYRELGGERPTTVVAIQRNPARPGYHSHALLCGRPGLLNVRRTLVWSTIRGEIGEWCKCGRAGKMCVGEAKIGAANVRPRIEPVNGVTGVTQYVVRYCMREDVESMVTVLPGDELAEKRGGPWWPAP